LLENALQAKHVDDLFNRVAVEQYERRTPLLHPGQHHGPGRLPRLQVPNAVYNATRLFPVTITSVYDKTQGRRVARHARTATRQCQPPRAHRYRVGRATPSLLPGYRVKVLDGNALAGTDHRIKELRDTKSAALPGKSLAVFDPAWTW
jgi:hypothetical protein